MRSFNISHKCCPFCCVVVFFFLYTSMFLLVFWLIRSDSKASFIRLAPPREQIGQLQIIFLQIENPENYSILKKIHKRDTFSMIFPRHQDPVLKSCWKPQFPFTSSLRNPPLQPLPLSDSHSQEPLCTHANCLPYQYPTLWGQVPANWGQPLPPGACEIIKSNQSSGTPGKLANPTGLPFIAVTLNRSSLLLLCPWGHPRCSPVWHPTLICSCK